MTEPQVTMCDKPKLRFEYDWTVCGSLQGITEWLRAHNPDCKGLVFQGEGWYGGDGNTLLVVAEDSQWRLFGWLNRDPRPMFERLLAMENNDV